MINCRLNAPKCIKKIVQSIVIGLKKKSNNLRPKKSSIYHEIEKGQFFRTF